MACGCANDVKRDIGPPRVVRTTAPLFASDEDKKEEAEKKEKEPPKEVPQRRIIKFM
jgi:hypothetical protein